MAATVADALGTRLLADATLGTLVSNRVYPSKPTQDPRESVGDHVVYWRITGGDGNTLSAANAYTWQECRVEAVAETQARAEAILNAVYASLTAWRDVAGGVQGCFARGDADEQTDDDGRQVSGQTFAVRFKPV